MHFIIIFIIIAGIVIWQFKTFFSTIQKLNIFGQILPKNNTQFVLGEFDGGEPGIIAEHTNPVMEVIIISINNYLQNNKGAVSDFHLIKDIVERNCDAKEEEIDTQIPIPLYLGLVGTMAGILVGVGSLWISGGLADLLSSNNGNGAKGVEALLGGVAIAMISSIIGILLTTWGAMQAKNSKVEVEKNKNIFLSWIQANLLPKLSDGAAATLEKVSQNLNIFNKTFSENTRELKETFSSVQNTYKDISSVLNAINHLRINDIAKYNIQVYEKMKNTTDEIGVLGEHLKGVNQYLSATTGVVQKLDVVFDREISQFDERIGAIKKAVGNIDNGISTSLTTLNDNTTIHLDEFRKSSVSLNEKFEKAVEVQQNTLQNAVSQQQQQFEVELSKQETNITGFLDRQNKALESKSKEVENLVTELQNLTAVKTSIGRLEQFTKEQNSKLDRLSQAIEKLAQMKLDENGGVGKPLTLFPQWVKISGFAIGGSIAFAGLFSVVVKVLGLTGVIR